MSFVASAFNNVRGPMRPIIAKIFSSVELKYRYEIDSKELIFKMKIAVNIMP